MAGWLAADQRPLSGKDTTYSSSQARQETVPTTFYQLVSRDWGGGIQVFWEKVGRKGSLPVWPKTEFFQAAWRSGDVPFVRLLSLIIKPAGLPLLVAADSSLLLFGALGPVST